MDSVKNMAEIVQIHMSSPAGMVFYDSLESVREDQNLTGYVSVIRRAWEQMRLDGVLCLDGRPVLYLKNYDRPFSARERTFLQRLFWNQGVANIFVLADPALVYIYSGLAKPSGDSQNNKEIDNREKEKALVEILTLTDYVQQIQTFYHRLATGHYYEKNQEHFDPDQSVDSWLLGNLRALRNGLIKGDEKLCIKDAHAFIGRVLFLSYLLDRDIITVGKTGRNQTGTMLLAELLEKKSSSSKIDYLYKLFADLKIRFNGNMFDQDIEVEKALINTSHLQKLTLFLGGHDVGSGQHSLGFWPYDFKMIPVETISVIYQEFLSMEDPEDQRKKGAFYTPRFLAEMVVDVTINDETDIFNRSFLDPSCGSGIFLVILFNRLANHWLRNREKVQYVTKARALQKILARHICGVDVSETACRIACFSLYLAYLDFFDPPDIQEHMKKTGEPLPKLLNYGDTSDRPEADIPVIHKGDFFSENILLGKTFDCIIGNPPWEGRGTKQLAQKFMQRVPQFLKQGGVGCLLLPTKILQNRTDAFQVEWLQQVSLEKVLQLADYRHLLFHYAKTPAFIARFTNIPPQLNQFLIEFCAPKFNRDGIRQGVITVSPSSRTWIPLSDIISAACSKTAPGIWKQRLWGTHRDQKLLDLLQTLPPLSDLAGTPKEGKRWIKGQGFQPNTSGKSENPKLPWWEKTDLYIDVKAPCWNSSCLQLQYDDCEEICDRFPSLHRTRDQRIYLSPMVLISRGFGKVAFCDFDVLFQHYLQSITGSEEDTDILMFLTAYLRSNLAKYFLFHTSTNLGTERDYVNLVELLRAPFPLPGNDFISPDAKQIVEQVVLKFNKLRGDLKDYLAKLKSESKEHSLLKSDDTGIRKKWYQERKKLTDALQKEIEPLIYKYFGLTDQEIILVEDTVRVFIPSSTPTSWRSEKTVTLDPIEKTKVEPYADQGLKAYADILSQTLNQWANNEGSGYCVCAEGGTDNKTGLAMVTLKLSQTKRPYQPQNLLQGFAEMLKIFHEHSSKKHGTLIYERDIFLFQEDQIRIVRPNILLNWTRTAALNDAARIYGDIAFALENLS